MFGNVSETREKIDRVCDLLRLKEYEAHRLGDITSSSVLGCRVERDRKTRTCTIDVQEYIENFLKNTKDENNISYWDSNEIRKTPCDPQSKILSKEMNATTDEEKTRALKYSYLSRIMSLMYASLVARPDIAYAVSAAARFAANPGPKHIAWVEHIIRYLRGTSALRLTYNPGEGELRMRVFSDTSWLDEVDNRHTTMGRAIFVGECLIDWKSKLIRRVMTSTNHAEFYGMNEAVKDGEFFRIMSEEIEIKRVAEKIEILGDNAKAISLAQGLLSHSDNRYYDLCLYYQREIHDLGRIFYTLIKGTVNVADYFTKGILIKSVEINHKVRSLLGLR